MFKPARTACLVNLVSRQLPPVQKHASFIRNTLDTARLGVALAGILFCSTDQLKATQFKRHLRVFVTVMNCGALE